ncbi:F-box protein [Striga hermonthica]|uniref:F-box protein n=1 Tax=Striga hermonthica TaxID=68872 RepID=A0A9N7R599_STRHE|nr:F-box protein [Striga hermonthica]
MLLGKRRKLSIRAFQVPPIKRILSARFDFERSEEVKEEKNGNFLLDLPDLPLDCILEKLSPVDLFNLVRVCSCLREKCTSDHLWENHMKRKWGGVIGDDAYREWQCQMASKRAPKFLHCKAQRGLRLFSRFFDFFGFKSESKKVEKIGLTSYLPENSVMSFYLALETGKFWFPAQVFNREKGHLGFVLSCYDARLSYDSTTDNFVARYRAQGRSIIEDGIEWNQIRAPAINAPANAVYISKCLDELKPGDHIEIQWRKNKEFPYGWWYGVVGHLESCFSNQFNCQCHINDNVILEFKQYSTDSRWRKVVVSRKDHRETGNETDGFYGGIRKLHKKEEIAKWKELWPKYNVILEFKQYSTDSRWRKAVVSRKDHRETGNETDGFYGGIRKLHKKEEIAKWEELWPKCTLE